MLDLIVNGFLDRESVANYSLVVRAQDGGSPPRQGSRLSIYLFIHISIYLFIYLSNFSLDVLATVLEEMPPFPEKESNGILNLLKKKRPGRVPDNPGSHTDI